MIVQVRAAAAQVISRILRQQGSLSSVLPVWQSQVREADRALLQELCFGCMRWYPQLQRLSGLLLEKPMRAKDSDVHALLLLGIYQLMHTRIPDHAAIGETVEAARSFKKPWATGLINGVLRRFQREREDLETRLANDHHYQSNHPEWLLSAFQRAWPQQLASILQVNDQHPPFTLRVNRQHIDRDHYLHHLTLQEIAAVVTPFSDDGIRLERPVDPRTLPGFAAGDISVQDEAAQLAAGLLQLQPGLRVLDACAAPGGKTGHIFEQQPDIGEVTALDSDERRLQRVTENLQRLGVEATLKCGDASQPDSWWDGQLFDRILLDAPCSATGIIRRHPDIKALRTADDIARLAALQGKILDALWPLLADDGVLVYATCSIMPDENTRVVEAFLQRQPDVVCDRLDVAWGLEQPCGRQLLPQSEGHDGFYYARLRKPAKTA
ncbi:16S rRNA (cytosine(967)-C(5))-methyltransferase RsmB [Cellvibrio sp. KB43]|uniref:16S rRNA (cytosine(967)-C(5))-methyltransferase n=1 Tax=Cellvibrio polysaccharolyticus TaxID=2082724 RepID=A0A928V2T8_9GAMM|nr:16S rRNA (cytosine(967)-C(5))-methyltransferase RsmB [Cellvibrio polysaccharolyticus]MBE8715599.1 16S rRNA (cytosine(967)-C(5))-methyltransferase RsmB [Cellvibrio polysaccharolyticus]